jgi:8-amino-7-oxononanoate synthase
LLAATIRAALGVIERADDRRAALAERVRRVGEALRRLAVAQPSGTHIQPVIVGSDKSALALAERMQAHGHDIRAIRPPTVPEGTARLRISLTLNVSDVQTDAMIALLAQELAEAPS